MRLSVCVFKVKVEEVLAATLEIYFSLSSSLLFNISFFLALVWFGANFPAWLRLVCCCQSKSLESTTKKIKCDPIRFFICIHVSCNRRCILFAQFAFVCSFGRLFISLCSFNIPSISLNLGIYFLLLLVRVALPSTAANAVWSLFLLSMRSIHLFQFSPLSVRNFFLAPFLFHNRNGTSFFVSSFHLVRWFDYKLYACVCASTWLHKAMCPLILYSKLVKEKNGDCEFWISIRRMSRTVCHVIVLIYLYIF